MKPVAWMVDGVLFTSLGAALNISFDIEQPCIPLYTHQYERPHNTVLVPCDKLAEMQAEIEDLKNANRFIQNFAEEQHKRAVALEMRELTDEEIIKVYEDMLGVASARGSAIDFARAILKKAQDK